MVFEETIEELDLKVNKPNRISKIRIDLEPERELKLQQIIKVYTAKNRKISRTKLIKMAIDNLIVDVEEQPSEEEGIEFLRSLYKEAEF